MSKNIKKIIMDWTVGDFNSIFTEAHELSVNYNCEVEFLFNNKVIKINEGSDVVTTWKRYVVGEEEEVKH